MRKIGEAIQPAAYLLLRVAVGLIFLMHGQQKLFGGLENFTGGLASMGFPFPDVMAVLAALSEFAGGILLLLGLFTRCAALPIIIVMLVAVFGVHLKNGLIGQGGFEYPLVLLLVNLLFFATGGGNVSIDRVLGRR